VENASKPRSDQADLGGHREGHPERLDRAEHGGTLIEAEHVARYRWIAGQAKGRRVLDAGCGTAYGTEILAAAGASEVVGLDRAADVLDAIAGRMPEQVRLEAGDLLDLPLEDGRFDLVVCFEVLEHLEDPERGLDELKRVLSEDGLLAVSSPNRRVFPAGNPHHVHEFIPEELIASLQGRFAHAMLVRQHAWVASAILEDAATGEDAAGTAGLAKTAAIEPGEEIFTLGLASGAELPELAPHVALGPPVDQAAQAEHARVSEERRLRVEEQAQRLAGLEAARHRLVEAEQRLAKVPALEAAAIELAAIKSSPSWRLTAPLRRAKAKLGHSAPPVRMALKRALATVLYRLRQGVDR